MTILVEKQTNKQTNKQTKNYLEEIPQSMAGSQMHGDIDHQKQVVPIELEGTHFLFLNVTLFLQLLSLFPVNSYNCYVLW